MYIVFVGLILFTVFSTIDITSIRH